MHVQNKSNSDLREVEGLIDKFYPYAKKQLGFNKDVNVVFQTDAENASNPLGNTAYYTPDNPQITIFVDNRHPKDILRSVSHELVHHAQNCRGDFQNQMQTEDGYAQKDPHLREMEREAYEKGNMIFRDWTDTLSETLQRRTKSMSLNENQMKEAIREALSKFDLKLLKEKYYEIDDNEPEKSRHAGSKNNNKIGTGAGYSSGITNVTEELPGTSGPIVTAKDAIRMNEINPFVMIGGKTYLWEESDGVNLKVSDQEGASHDFKVTDVEEIEVPDVEAPLNEWYKVSLYDRLLTESVK